VSNVAAAAPEPAKTNQFLVRLSNYFLGSHLSPPMRKGTKVSWKYGTGTATGKIESVHKESITRKLKGHDITRNGSADDPALVIVQDNGDKVIKLQSEVKAAA
jgi:hypothetical protein